MDREGRRFIYLEMEVLRGYYLLKTKQALSEPFCVEQINYRHHLSAQASRLSVAELSG